MIESDDARWRAVLDRDRAADGRFVFAVRTTGVFCRPSCPARRPRRDNVAFFASPAEAAAGGFRPCRRCRPDERAAAGPAWLARLCRLIDESEAPPTLGRLAALAGVGPDSLRREFRRALGVSPRQYAEARRTARLKQELRKGTSVTEAMYDAGYGSSSRLYERSTKELGMTPGKYLRRAEGLDISFAMLPSPLGRVLVAATGRGVCFVGLGESDARLEIALREEFAAARTIRRDDAELGSWARGIVTSLAGRSGDPAVPLDIRATAFQRSVWDELRRIPRGETRSYAEVARAIGRPRAVRAVARACATNPVAVVVPCHRVVGSDGALTGYRWGLERKRALLEREGRAAERSQARRTSSTKRPARPSELR
jgi:AraC family transcriptional regulator of adaptative response/methylated-DNA-[protein]-cysteine methyltransferase